MSSGTLKRLRPLDSLITRETRLRFWPIKMNITVKNESNARLQYEDFVARRIRNWNPQV